MAVVGVLGLGATAQQVVGEGDRLAAALPVADEAADCVVAALLVVGRRRGAGRGGV